MSPRDPRDALYKLKYMAYVCVQNLTTLASLSRSRGMIAGFDIKTGSRDPNHAFSRDCLSSES